MRGRKPKYIQVSIELIRQAGECSGVDCDDCLPSVGSLCDKYYRTSYESEKKHNRRVVRLCKEYLKRFPTETIFSSLL